MDAHINNLHQTAPYCATNAADYSTAQQVAMDESACQIERCASAASSTTNSINRPNSSSDVIVTKEASQSPDAERRPRPQKYCAVCGDKAIACNFNAVTCESCKAFFRRNAFKEQRLKCLFDSRCLIDRVTRRFCSKCRLLKCIAIGMKREWILTDEQKQIKRVKILQNKQQRQLQQHNQVSSAKTNVSPRTHQAANVNQTNHSTRRKKQATQQARQADAPDSTGRRETRDVATSCPEDSEAGCTLHYCSFALQCQYCSLLMANQTELQRNQRNHSHSLHHPQARTSFCPPNYQSATGHQPASNMTSFAPMHHHPNTSQSQAAPMACCCVSPSLGQALPHQSQPTFYDQHQQNQQHQHQQHPHQHPHQHHHHHNHHHQPNPFDHIQASPISSQQLHVMTPVMPQAHTETNSSQANFVAPQHSQHQNSLTHLQTHRAFSVVMAPGENCQSPSACGGLESPANSNHQMSQSQLQLNDSFKLNHEQQLSPSNQEYDNSVANYEQQASNSNNNTKEISLKQEKPNTSSTLTENATNSSNNDDGTDTRNSDTNESLVSTNDQTCSPETVVYNGEVYTIPAFTEAELIARIEKINFNDSERNLLNEVIEATRFMFDASERCYHKHPINVLDELVYSCDAALRRLIQTVKEIKAFRMLSMDDQILLLKTACFKILLLRSTFHYQEEIEGWCDYKTGKVMRIDILKRAKKSLVYEKHRDILKKIPEPLRKDRLIMGTMTLIVLFDPNVGLEHSNSVNLDNLIYLSILRKYLMSVQPDPLTKYQSLVDSLQVINTCNEEYNVFFSKDFQPEQITPLLNEIFDISIKDSRDQR